MYYSFNKYRQLKTVDTFIYIFAVRKWSGSSACNIFGTRILTVFNRLHFQTNIISQLWKMMAQASMTTTYAS